MPVLPRTPVHEGRVAPGGRAALGEAIPPAFVPPLDASAGTMLPAAVRDTTVDAEVVPLPFCRRRR
jgi:hypothetical protein